jgi:hypothetical protein
MRLNGKAPICEYLGVNPRNWRGWQLIKLRYGRVILIKRATGKVPRYWCLTEELDAIDREQSVSVYDKEYARLVAYRTTTTESMANAYATRIKRRELVAV